MVCSSRSSTMFFESLVWKSMKARATSALMRSTCTAEDSAAPVMALRACQSDGATGGGAARKAQQL